MYCEKCGKQVENNYRFCIGCGSPIRDMPTAVYNRYVPPQAAQTVGNNRSNETSVLILTALTLVSPFCPLLYYYVSLVGKGYDTMFNISFFSVLLLSISDDPTLEQFAFFALFICCVYWGLIIMGITYTVSAFKKRLSNNVYPHLFWSNCRTSNIVLACSYIPVYLFAKEINTIGLEFAGRSYDLASLTVVSYVLIFSNVAMAIYSNKQMKFYLSRQMNTRPSPPMIQ